MRTSILKGLVCYGFLCNTIKLGFNIPSLYKKQYIYSMRLLKEKW